MNFRHLDVSRWPVVIYDSPPVVSNEELRESLDEIQIVRRLGEPHVIVIDLRDTLRFPKEQQKMITAAMDAHDYYVRRFGLGVAFIFDSAMMRLVFRAITLMRRPVGPLKVFKSRHSALLWARRQVQNARIVRGTAAAA